MKLVRNLKKQLLSLQPQGKCYTLKAYSQQGFTLLEALIVVFIVGILAAIGTPSWLSMLNNSRLNQAQDAIAIAIGDAQRQARQTKSSRQVTIQQGPSPGRVQWAVHRSGNAPTGWQNIEQDRLILASSPSPFSITFDDKGHTNQTGIIKISLQNGSPQRCVIVQTLLGTVRKAQGDACIEP